MKKILDLIVKLFLTFNENNFQSHFTFLEHSVACKLRFHPLINPTSFASLVLHDPSRDQKKEGVFAASGFF